LVDFAPAKSEEEEEEERRTGGERRGGQEEDRRRTGEDQETGVGIESVDRNPKIEFSPGAVGPRGRSGLEV
jgi:hypothetical protein